MRKENGVISVSSRSPNIILLSSSFGLPCLQLAIPIAFDHIIARRS